MAGMAIAGGLLAAGSLAASLARKGQRVSVPDISSQIAQIRALYAQARATAEAEIRKSAGQTRSAAASNLAARGVYRSPVSENTFGRIRDAMSSDIARSHSDLSMREADAIAGMTGSLMSANMAAQRFNSGQAMQREEAIFGSLGALGSSLLMAGLRTPPQGGTPPISSGMNPFAGRYTMGRLNLPQSGINYPSVPALGFNPAIFSSPQGSGYLAALRAMGGRV